MKKNNIKINGFIPAIVQNWQTGRVLMLAYMNQQAYEKTIKTGLVTFYSRSKKRLWTKGETSNNFLQLKSIELDCDQDTLLIQVKPQGPTCHTNKKSCFDNFQLYKQSTSADLIFIKELFDLIKSRKKDLPEKSYTTKLFKAGDNKILSKLNEETKEILKAVKQESKARQVEEICDLLYHLLVLMAEKNISLKNIIEELKKRNK